MLSIKNMYIALFDDKVSTGSFLYIESAIIKAKKGNDGGTSLYTLHVYATIFSIKGKPFDVPLTFFPEMKISSLLEEA